MRRLPLLLFVVLLAACASRPPVDTPPPDTLAERVAAVGSLDGWTLTGRAALRHEDRSGSLNISWVQTGEAYHVRLYAPLGAGGLSLKGRPGQVSLETSEGLSDQADSPEALVYRHTRLRLPVTALRYWLLGVPAPDGDRTAMDVNGDGLLAGFEQFGWRVSYPDYTVAAGLAMPRKVFIERDDAYVRLVVQQWRLNP